MILKYFEFMPRDACILGVDQAIVLRTIQRLSAMPNSGRVIRGKRWIWNTSGQWHDGFFPFWSEVTIRRLMRKLEKAGYIASCQPDGVMSRKKYYRVKSPKEMVEESRRNSGLKYKDWYHKVYLKSKHWKISKMLVLSHYGSVCQSCKKTGPVDVHHLNYRNIFDVRLDELKPLCRECHKAAHGIK